MRKFVMVALVAALVGGLVAAPATAGKKKKKAKPVQTVLYFHGNAPFGEADGVQWFADGTGTPPGTLTPDEPTDAQPKSQNFFSPALNDQCTGLPIAFPTFQGPVEGKIVGDVKMTAHFLSAPTTVTARLWTDVPVFTCNDAYVQPASEVQVDVPAGNNEVEIVFEDLNLTSQAWMLVEILVPSGTDYRGQVGRFLYDSTATPTRLEFNCIPASGGSCIP
ncbi:MAG: hypothetical protein ACLGHL_10100 [Actinomycetota bacterium]